MQIFDFIDIYDPEHMKAYHQMSTTGWWPPGFLPDDITFTPFWQLMISLKMALAWADYMASEDKLKVIQKRVLLWDIDDMIRDIKKLLEEATK